MQRLVCWPEYWCAMNRKWERLNSKRWTCFKDIEINKLKFLVCGEDWLIQTMLLKITCVIALAKSWKQPFSWSQDYEFLFVLLQKSWYLHQTEWLMKTSRLRRCNYPVQNADEALAHSTFMGQGAPRNCRNVADGIKDGLQTFAASARFQISQWRNGPSAWSSRAVAANDGNEPIRTRQE